MTHVAAIAFALLVFLVSSALLWLGRASIGTNNTLLLIIVAGYVIALAAAFPASMALARCQCVEWYRAWKSLPRADGAS